MTSTRPVLQQARPLPVCDTLSLKNKPKRAKQIRDVRVFAANSRHLRSCCVRRAQRRERQGRVRPRPHRFSNPPSSRRPCWRGDPQSGQRPLRLSGDVHASLFSLIASRYAGQPISSRALATPQKRISAMARKSEQERWSGFLTGDAYHGRYMADQRLNEHKE